MVEEKKRRRKIISYVISVIALLLTATVVTATLVLPGLLMKRGARRDQGVVMAVPAAYYSGPSDAVVKNASRQLTEEQRIRLIYGEWESEISPASGSECSLTEYEVVTGFTYPVVSKYQQWYTWQAEAYKAVDTTFATYMAVYWRVTFTKYDGSEIHEYYITEGGTLLEESKIRK